jgi:hypothetical protein
MSTLLAIEGEPVRHSKMSRLQPKPDQRGETSKTGVIFGGDARLTGRVE